MTQRKLASIQRIHNIQTIPGADAIVTAEVLGWQVVIRKDEFQLNDLCVYCEIDSLIPEKPEFEFLRNKSFRIRTLRLRGQISQGICFPLSILPEGIDLHEGMDVTHILGIQKFEPPIPTNLAGQMKGGFPSFIPKTDETRVQVLANVLKQFEGLPCYITEKLDGSSVTYYWYEGEFNVCSRNLNIRESEQNSMWRMAYQLDLATKLQNWDQPIALQGEIIGEGIQANKYKLKGHSVRFFNVFLIEQYRFLDCGELVDCLHQLDLPMVPLLDTNYQLEADIPTLVSRSQGKSKLNSHLPREGIIIRPLQEQRTSIDGLGRLSFKVINPEFLLKYE